MSWKRRSQEEEESPETSLKTSLPVRSSRATLKPPPQGKVKQTDVSLSSNTTRTQYSACARGYIQLHILDASLSIWECCCDEWGRLGTVLHRTVQLDVRNNNNRSRGGGRTDEFYSNQHPYTHTHTRWIHTTTDESEAAARQKPGGGCEIIAIGHG